MLPHSPTPSTLVLLAVLSVLVTSAPTLEAQEAPPVRLSDDEFRFGVTLGGTGFLGVVAEYRRGNWSGELTLGTITFREISVSLAGKHYFSEGSLRPAVGLGLWSLTAWTEDGSGSILILRVPVAADWRFHGGHAAGLEVGMNRALAVNRLDPEDDTPARDQLVPIPGLYYRHGSAP